MSYLWCPSWTATTRPDEYGCTTFVNPGGEWIRTGYNTYDNTSDIEDGWHCTRHPNTEIEIMDEAWELHDTYHEAMAEDHTHCQNCDSWFWDMSDHLLSNADCFESHNDEDRSWGHWLDLDQFRTALINWGYSAYWDDDDPPDDDDDDHRDYPQIPSDAHRYPTTTTLQWRRRATSGEVGGTLACSECSLTFHQENTRTLHSSLIHPESPAPPQAPIVSPLPRLGYADRWADLIPPPTP